MKIAVAQTRPVKGDIPANIEHHKRLTDLAISFGAEYVFFPELSITGYEPTLVKDLATNLDDPRFEVFQHVSDRKNVTLGLGAPTQSDNGIRISMLLFQPHRPRNIYSKMYLHESEVEFFAPGPSTTGIIGKDANIALAICYELSVPEHAANAAKNGADIYLASVVEPVECMEKSLKRLSEIAHEYSMTVLMSNCVGRSHRWQCGGRSSVWNTKGELLDSLDDTGEGIFVVDTETHDVVNRPLS